MQVCENRFTKNFIRSALRYRRLGSAMQAARCITAGEMRFSRAASYGARTNKKARELQVTSATSVDFEAVSILKKSCYIQFRKCLTRRLVSCLQVGSFNDAWRESTCGRERVYLLNSYAVDQYFKNDVNSSARSFDLCIDFWVFVESAWWMWLPL